ncbi:MAG: hypothetical protein IKD08_04895 [Alphaproteobacteria bacterium]|nr:hypothetical protein [Alphaproteobacteria bacterium]
MRTFLIGCAWLVVAGFIAIGSFVLKNHVIELEDNLKTTNRQILEDQKSIHVLKAEWSHLNEPGRLRKLSEKYLHMHPLKAEQFISINDIPFQNKAPEGKI